MNHTDPIIYTHPDGFELHFAGDLLTAITDDGEAISIPIGGHGLADVAQRLQAHADAIATAQDDAKNAGFLLACNLRGDIADLRGQHHPEAVHAMRSALGQLAKQNHLDHAISGFSLALAHTLECGIAHAEPYGQPRP